MIPQSLIPQRNGSAEYEREWEMSVLTGEVTQWDGQSDLASLYPPPCSTLSGSAEGRSV